MPRNGKCGPLGAESVTFLHKKLSKIHYYFVEQIKRVDSCQAFTRLIISTKV